MLKRRDWLKCHRRASSYLAIMTKRCLMVAMKGDLCLQLGRYNLKWGLKNQILSVSRWHQWTIGNGMVATMRAGMAGLRLRKPCLQRFQWLLQRRRSFHQVQRIPCLLCANHFLWNPSHLFQSKPWTEEGNCKNLARGNCYQDSQYPPPNLRFKLISCSTHIWQFWWFLFEYNALLLNLLVSRYPLTPHDCVKIISLFAWNLNR